MATKREIWRQNRFVNLVCDGDKVLALSPSRIGASSQIQESYGYVAPELLCKRSGLLASGQAAPSRVGGRG